MVSGKLADDRVDPVGYDYQSVRAGDKGLNAGGAEKRQLCIESV